METVLKTASVKIMLSYDYSHFEVAMSIENEAGLALADIDNARKDCQRLADKAVSQYKIAKDAANKRINSSYEKANFLRDIKTIQSKNEQDRTIEEIAMLKKYEDDEWERQFDCDYDYEDDYK
jgi:hypothetical protein